MTYLQFLALLVLYMAWMLLLLRVIVAEEPIGGGETSPEGEANQPR